MLVVRSLSYLSFLICLNTFFTGLLEELNKAIPVKKIMQIKDFFWPGAQYEHNKCYHLFSSSPIGFLLTPTFYDFKNHLVTDCTNGDEQNQWVLTYLDLKAWSVFSPLSLQSESSINTPFIP